MFGFIGNIGPWELILILVIVLIVVGPGKLPQVGKSMGGRLCKAFAKPRRMTLKNWRRKKKNQRSDIRPFFLSSRDLTGVLKMTHYPIYLNLVNRLCLVIGGGKVAERKIQTLLEYGARVTVVSPELQPSIRQWFEEGKISYIQEPFRPDMLEGFCWFL